MKKILTIVIPTYNMQDYLCRCLDSLIVPDNLMDIFEILVINDGSKDGSLKIAHRYQIKYPKTFRVIDKENGNYGSCINRGLAEAKGKYIKVLDADDWFNTQSLTAVLNVLQNIDDDVIISDAACVRDGIEKKMNKINIPSYKHLEMSSYLLSNDILCMQMHKIIYKTELLRSINYRQSEGISYTDQEWMFLPMAVAKTFYYIPITLYIYLLGREGQTMDKKNLIKCIGHTEKGVLKMIDDYNKSCMNLSVSQQHYLLFRIYQRLKYIYKTYIFSTELQDSELKQFDNILKSKSEEIYRYIETIKLNRIYPIKFIKLWRLNKGLIFVKLWNKIRKYISLTTWQIF